MLFKTLPILMYHQVIATGHADELCILATDIEEQLNYICKKGYTTISIQQLINFHYYKTPLPLKPILLTLDDGYKNNFTTLYSLLLKYNVKATIFLNPSNIINNDNEIYLSVDEILTMQNKHVEFSLHTFKHDSYNDLSVDEILIDIKKSIQWFIDSNISFTSAHAYTYGAYPKKDKQKLQAIINNFKACGIKLAFRIGNRLNFFPLKNPYLIQRIDIKGTDSFAKFKRKLKYGAKYLLY